MKKLLAIFLSFLMLLGFAACGGDKEEAFDPNLGIYEAYTASLSGFEMRVTDLYAGGFTIELKEKGKCVITVDSDTANGKWSLQGSIINVSGGGIELTGTLKEGEMVFEKLMGTDVTMKFRNTAFTPLKEETAEKQGEPVRQNESPVENQPIATQAGTYYYLHHYEISGQTVTNDIIKANGMDVYYVRMNSDGTGEFCPLSENALPMTYTDSVLRVENYLAMEYTLEGDTLTVDMVGTKLTFVKGSAPAASIPEAPVVNDPPVVVENPAQAPVLTQAPASTQAPVVTQAPSAALHPGEPSSSGDGTVADLESIYRLYAWFERMPSQYRKSYCTYDTIVSFTGVEGLDDGNSGPNSITDLGYHNFKWGFDEKRFIQDRKSVV